jgi:hypothetical protein
MSWQDAPKVTPTRQQTPKSSSWKTAPKIKSERSLMDTAAEAVQNIPSSGLNFLKSMVSAVETPEALVKTVGTALDLGAGALNRAVPAQVRDFINRFDTDPASTKRAVQTAQQVGGVYRQRYGSVEALKRTIATDPVGAAADLSTILSGGAGVARLGGKTTARVSNAMTRAAELTNPINALAAPARVIPKALERAPAAVQQIISPKQSAYLEAAEGRAPELIAQLRAPSEIVPGSKPTAAQAASPLNLTQFSALGASAEKAAPTPYYVRGAEQEAARLEAMSGVAKTPEDITAAITARTAATDPLYAAAEAKKFLADPKLMQLADDPYIKQALPEALRLSKSQGATFESNPTLFLHNVKISLDDMLSKTGDTALVRGARSQVMDVRKRLLGWLEGKVPEYGAARTTFAEMSKPINQMEVGQYLENKLKTSLEAGGERANVFAAAVKDAPGTLKRATTNEARFKELTDVLTPEQAKIVTDIRDDLARAAKTNIQARKGAAAGPKVTDMATAAQRSARPPQMLNRITTLANDIWSRLQGKIDTKLAIEIANEMLNPQVAANMLAKSLAGQTRAAKIGEAGGATARAAGKVLRSPAALAAERAQNAMNESNYPTLVEF